MWNEKKVKLMDYVSFTEKTLNIKAKKKYLPLQKDIKKFIDWYKVTLK